MPIRIIVTAIVPARFFSSGIIIFTALFLRFVVGGPEDDWICKDGQWVNYSLNTALDEGIRQIINHIILILAKSGQIKTDLEKLKAVNRKDICR